MTDDDDAAQLTLGGPAAGGTCVAHDDGVTWFVRGGLPGEVVMVRQTGAKNRGRIRFADVMRVMAASEDRVEPPCPAAGVCGGCDLQHVAYDAQLRWKSQVLADQLARIGRIETVGSTPVHAAVRVRPVALPGEADGLGWRSRVAVSIDAAGRACFHGRRSDELVAVPGCPVAVPELQGGFAACWQPPGQRTHWALGEHGTVVGPAAAAATADAEVRGWQSGGDVVHSAAGRSWTVALDGFWQSHVAAADVLADAVRGVLAPRVGDSLIDLYAGVGLFGGALAADVGAQGSVLAVEGDRRAAALARINLADLPQVRVVRADVRRWAASGRGAEALGGADLVVLDPPRTGAGAPVVTAVAAGQRLRAIAYVACDGGSLARDAAILREHGWELNELRAFDLFGMSHHVEAVAGFRRA